MDTLDTGCTQVLKDCQSHMQTSRQRDEVIFCHAMGADELNVHLLRKIIPGDCALCEWFGRSGQALAG